MNDIPRRTIPDLAARYALEPALRDVFVEGEFDQEVISRTLKEAKHPDRIVYEIDSIEVPDELVLRHGLTTGNKQRVIVLARELSGLPILCAFRCLVDRDMDHWFGPLETTSRLVWTDYCSLELYFFTDETIRDILVTTARCRVTRWQDFRDSMTNALRTMYLLRLANRELDWKLQWLSVDRCLSLKSGRVSLDLQEYIRRILLQNGRGKQKAEFDASVDRWLAKINGDDRLAVHGHDLVEMLAWAILKYRGLRQFASVEAITRLLVLMAPRANGVIQQLD